jgi:replication factor A1
MQKNVDELYNEVKDIKTKEEFKAEIKKIQEEYDELFDEETAALLIVDMLGRNKGNTLKINELESGIECTITGEITDIGEIRSFNRKNGSTGRVVNLELADETGSCKLALWHSDVELIENNSITLGSRIRIVNGYVKNGYNGVEINVGRWGMIDIEKNAENDKKIKNKNVAEGKIIEIQPSKAFFKDDGKFGFVTNIVLKNDKGTKQITLWDEKVKEIQDFKKGDKIKIEKITAKNKNGKTEYHLNVNAKIEKI